MVRVTRHILSKEIQLVSITRRQKIVQDMTRATQICLYLLVLLIVVLKYINIAKSYSERIIGSDQTTFKFIAPSW